MNKRVQLSVILVSYNTRALTLQCLRSILDQTKGMEFQIVVVDNCSTDESAQSVATEFPQVKLIRSDSNLGFAGANNLAARHADGQWLLLLNPDTIVLDGAVDKLFAFASSHPQASIFGGRTLFPDRSLNPFSCWRRPTPWSLFCIGVGLSSVFRKIDLFNPEAYGGWKRDTEREVEIVSGCFFLIQRDLWDQLGGFDEAFFMYGEEVDLCWRAAKIGKRCLICPDAQVIHYGGASEKVRSDAMVKIFVAKAAVSKYWSERSHWFGLRMLDLWAGSRMVVHGAFQCARRQQTESFQTWQSVWRRRAEWNNV